MGIHRGPRIVTDGCVLALDAADRNSYPGSGASWFDLTGRGNTCTLFNSPTYSASNGGAIVFNGSTQYGQITDSSSNNFSTGTVSIWFNCSNVSGIASPSTVIIDRGGTFGREGWYFTLSSAGGYVVGYKAANDTQYNCSGTGIVSNRWYNLVMTMSSGSAISMYLNGILINSIAAPTITIIAGNVRIADSADSFWSIFPGSIAGISMYNRALSASEVSQNFNVMRGRYGV